VWCDSAFPSEAARWDAQVSDALFDVSDARAIPELTQPRYVGALREGGNGWMVARVRVMVCA
jgi:hypothetical protein